MASSPLAALRARAIELHAAGRAREAEAAYEEVLATDPADGASLAALDSYDRCVAAHPQHAQAWSNRAVLLADLRRHDEAVESCERALALAPGLANAHNNRGISLAALGRLDEAVASYDRALAAGPPDAGVLNNRALALMASFRMGEALESAERALALQPALRHQPRPRCSAAAPRSSSRTAGPRPPRRCRGARAGARYAWATSRPISTATRRRTCWRR